VKNSPVDSTGATAPIWRGVGEQGGLERSVVVEGSAGGKGLCLEAAITAFTVYKFFSGAE